MSGLSEIDIKDMSDLDSYQEQAYSYAKPTAQSLMYLIPGLTGEAGEVASLYAKWVRDTQMGVRMPIKEDMVKELGDCMWFVASIAKLYNVKLSDIAKMNIEKLEGRLQRGTISGSGDHR